MLELRVRADKSGKPLRHENRVVRVGAGEDGEPITATAKVPIWPVSHAEVVGDLPVHHNFADTFIARALEDGYGEFRGMRVATTPGYDRNPVVTGDAFILKLKGQADAVYEILEHPGRYEDDSEAGYRVTHEYRCKLKGGKR